MKRITSRTLVLIAGFAIGLTLAHGLAGCVGPESAVGHVIRNLIGGGPALGEDGGREYARFEAAARDRLPTFDPEQLTHFRDAFSRVRAQYVQPLEDRPLIDAAIKGMNELKVADGEPEPGSRALVEAALDAMMAELDPHSGYLNPEEMREMQVSTRGEFGGLGILVTLDKETGWVKVISPIDDTPAFQAGIKAEDLITHLDGTAVKGMALADAVKMMRGKPGSRIRLTVKREGREAFEVAITRAVIQVEAVKWRAEGDMGYIRVTGFSERLEEGIGRAFDGLTAKLGPGMKGIVLDLRNNPGGLLEQSRILADAFLEGGQIVSIRGRDPARQRSYSAEPGDLAHHLPVVVLINGGSASASEIVAAALQDNHRALVMGTRSFGKGSVQVVSPLKLEGALKLTTDLYYVPSGRTIQGEGVVPDIVLEPAEMTEEEKKKELHRRESDLPHALKAENGAPRVAQARVKEQDCPAAGEKGDDRALGCALAYLAENSLRGFLSGLERKSAGR